MPFLDKQLNAGWRQHSYGGWIACCILRWQGRSTHSIDELPNEGVLPSAVKLTGLPKVGGASADESCRWIRDDKNPSYVNGVTLDNIDYAAFLEHFEYAIAKHAHHEFTRFFEGEMQRRVCGLERKAFWRQYMNAHAAASAMSFARPHRRHEASARPRGQGILNCCQPSAAGWPIQTLCDVRQTPDERHSAHFATLHLLCAMIRSARTVHARPMANAISASAMTCLPRLVEEKRLVIINELGEAQGQVPVKLLALGRWRWRARRCRRRARAARRAVDLALDEARIEFYKAIVVHLLPRGGWEGGG